jgi:hypothetical protein
VGRSGRRLFREQEKASSILAPPIKKDNYVWSLQSKRLAWSFRYIALLMEQGMKQHDAEMQAKAAKGLGSSLKIGDKMVSIKK